MSGRQDKKLRQLFRKTTKHQAEELGRILGNALKPKPRWIPQWVWIKLLGIFIIIRK